MRLAGVVILAYLTAAIYYIWRDLTERNVARMKPYAMRYRRTGDLTALLFAGAGWIVGVIANAKVRGWLSGQEAAPLGVFVGAAAALWLFLN